MLAQLAYALLLQGLYGFFKMGLMSVEGIMSGALVAADLPQ